MLALRPTIGACAPHSAFTAERDYQARFLIFSVRVLENQRIGTDVWKSFKRSHFTYYKERGKIQIHIPRILWRFSIFVYSTYSPLLKENLQRQKRNGMTTNTFCRFAIPISS